jgi:hypothetical protein
MKWDLSEAAVSERDRRARREKREPSAATPAAVGEQSVSCCCCVICGITAKNAIKHKLKGGKKNIVQAVDGYLCCRNRRCRQTIGARAKEPKEPTPTDAQTATAACDLPVPTSAATNKRRVATVVPAPSRHTFPARMAAKDAEIDEKAILINKLRSQISSMRHRSSKRDSSGCKCAYQCDKPLCGISIDFKIDSGSVPDYIRDLAVDLLCFRLEPAYKVFPIICDVLRTFGATIVHDVTSCTIVTLFLVERDIMLFDDMMMRVASSMAKRSLLAGAPLPEEALLEQSYTQSVEQHLVLKFLTDPNYKANKLPAPEAIEVGPLARVYETDDIGDEIEEQEAERNFQLDRKGCACHYYSIDGTNHQRNDREEVAHVIGGFEGAPPAGEFLDYTEMFS